MSSSSWVPLPDPSSCQQSSASCLLISINLWHPQLPFPPYHLPWHQLPSPYHLPWHQLYLAPYHLPWHQYLAPYHHPFLHLPWLIIILPWHHLVPPPFPWPSLTFLALSKVHLLGSFLQIRKTPSYCNAVSCK